MNANKTSINLPTTSRYEFIVFCSGLLLVLVSVAGCGSADPDASSDSTLSAKASSAGQQLSEGESASESADELAAAKAFLEKGDLDSSFRLLSKQLIKTPEDSQTLLLASRVEAAKGNRSTATELAESVSLDSPQAVEATNILVQLYVTANQPEDAVDRLMMSLDATSTTSSQAIIWRQQLWALFNRMGRRQEASSQADVLCRGGHFNRSLLISLLRRNESFPIELDGKPPQKSFYPGMGMARWSFSQGEFESALKHLSAEQESGFSSPAARALYGRLLAETQATDEFARWYLACDAETRRFSDYWIALGVYFFDQQQLEASARALLESIDVDPTDDDACHRLARVLAALGRSEDSEAMREHAVRVALLRTLVTKLSLQQPQPDLTGDLPEKLITLGRPFESIGWALLDLAPSNVAKRNGLIQQRDYLRNRPEVLGMASEVARMEIDRDDFSMDEAIGALATLGSTRVDANERGSPGSDPTQSPPASVTPALENVAANVGINFQWYHAKEIDLASLPLHQMMGGGIGVCDYDLDGQSDIYFCQGAGDPPLQQGVRSNQLLRNVGGRFIDVTLTAAAEDFHYSSGIAAGDVNQDGFPDLFLGAIGDNRLLVNNGDGTFRDSTNALGPMSPQFTSSVAIADLTGDAIPELFECVYVEMEDAFRLPDRDADGAELVPNPKDFFAEADRWYFSKGDGTFESRVIDRGRIEPGTSLGLVITDIDADGSNDVFISNDARPNHLLVHFGMPPIRNVAVLVGVAYGFRGYSNACMGIASGDFNRDGRIDLTITNYAAESNNHFLQSESGIFSDYATRYQLNTISEPYVGFGIKAIDFHRNGRLDLFVTNGHVFDQRDRGKSFRMPPQLVLKQTSKFISSEVTDPSDYWKGQYLGRSVAKIDFDRDLDIDLLVGHLDAPVALLANQTRRLGSGLQLQLIGTASERDATGTRVVVTVAGKQFTDWVTAGDGFLNSDDSMLDFGLGRADLIDSIEIHWISGQQQTFRDILTDRRYLVVEGAADLWTEDSSVEH